VNAEADGTCGGADGSTDNEPRATYGELAMKIQILGTGCAKCKTLFENTRKAVEESGVDAMVEKVEEIKEIMKFNILMTPGLAINGEVKAAGRVLCSEDIKKLIVASGGK
jgi:small redox-active disulfide protein 2